MNLLVLTGNLTKDAEIKYVGEKAVLNFSIAVNEGFGDRATTMFVNCVLWGNEKIAEYLKKGTKVALKGKLQITSKDNVYYTKMLVDNFGGVEFLSSKKDNKADNQTSNDIFRDTTFDNEDPIYDNDMPF